MTVSPAPWALRTRLRVLCRSPFQTVSGPRPGAGTWRSCPCGRAARRAGPTVFLSSMDSHPDCRGDFDGPLVECLQRGRTRRHRPAVVAEGLRDQPVAEEPAAHVRQRQNPADAARLAGDEIVAPVAERPLDHARSRPAGGTAWPPPFVERNSSHSGLGASDTCDLHIRPHD